MITFKIMIISLTFSSFMSFAGSDQDKAVEKVVSHTIEIKNFSFVPKVVKIAKGDRVIWINRDTILHSIVNSNSQETLSETLAKGDNFSYIAEEGMNYECGFHPSMTGGIVMLLQ